MGATVLNYHVLVLNKHYMPVRIVNVKRAVSLLTRHLAEVIDLDRGHYNNYDFGSWLEVSELKKEFEPDAHDFIHTVRISVAVPRIVRLLFYDRLPRKEVTLNRRNIYARDHNHCQYCGKKFPPSELSLDHVIPKTQGGKESWHNLVCACLRCNNRKGNRSPDQVGLALLRKPRQPNNITFISHFIGVPDWRWRSYLFMD